MQWLAITTPTELPVEALTLMGASDKDDRHIGQFGTGIKYAITAALRMGIDIQIWIGNKSYTFQVCNVNLGRRTVQQVYMNNQPRDWTTDLGKEHWKTEWMIIREFITNAIDEDKGWDWSRNDGVGAMGGTTVYLELTTEIDDIFKNLNYYVRPNDVEPLFKIDERISVFEGTGVRCKGILIRDAQTLYDYEFSDLKLNEHRDCDTWDILSRMGMAISRLPKNMQYPCLERIAIKMDLLERRVSEYQLNLPTSDIDGLPGAYKAAIKRGNPRAEWSNADKLSTEVKNRIRTARRFLCIQEGEMSVDGGIFSIKDTDSPPCVVNDSCLGIQDHATVKDIIIGICEAHSSDPMKWMLEKIL